MIVREQPDGSLVMICQTDHAKLSGQLAAHWGNTQFNKPRPYESVVRAATFHDSGWYDYETGPTINPETGKTLNFMQVPWGPVQRRAFQWAVDWMTDLDPYSGMLLSRHRTGLQRGRYGVLTHPTFYNTKNIPDDNVDFLNSNEEKQQQALKNYDAAEFATNYRLFQAWDLLSLELCNKDALNGDFIEPVPVSYDVSKSPPVKMSLTTLEPRTVEIIPYPFVIRPLNVHLTRRRLPISTFPDLATFRQAYYQAPIETVTFKLI